MALDFFKIRGQGFNIDDDLYIIKSNGTPEGNINAPAGSLCLDYTNGELYLKNTGSGNTGWIEFTKDNWNSVYSTVNGTSANWDSVYSTVNSNSASWDNTSNTLQTVTDNGATTTTPVTLANVTINGDLTVLGDTFSADVSQSRSINIPAEIAVIP